MLMPVNEKYPTRRFGRRQQNFRECDICLRGSRRFRDYPGCVLIENEMEYVLCKTHLRFARNHRDHFHVVVKAFNLGTPVEECEL